MKGINMKQLSLESLERELALVRHDRETMQQQESLLEQLIKARKSQGSRLIETQKRPTNKKSNRKSLRRDDVVNAIITFLGKNNGEARSGDIQAHLEAHELLARGNQSGLSHLLKIEATRHDGEIKKVRKGIYALRK